MRNFAGLGWTEWLKSNTPLSPLDAVDLRDTFTNLAAQNDSGDSCPRVSSNISKAEIVLWDIDILSAANRGAGALVGIPCPKLPDQSQVWVFQHYIDFFAGTAFAIFIDSHSGFDGDNYLEDSKTGQRLPDRSFATVDTFALSTESDGPPPYGLKIVSGSQLIEGAPVDESVSSPLAWLLFLATSWIDTQAEPLPRPVRRRYERERQPVPDVKTVVLRRSAHEGETHSNSEGGREYSCQWIVSGHWRAHWHPKEGVHKPLYIASYPKGPADKPLKPERPTVYLAKR